MVEEERKQRRFGGPRRFGGQRFQPVKVGEELDVTIEAVGEKGDGIAKKDGFVLFVPGVKEGDNVRIKVTKVFRKVGFAEVVGEAAPSEEAGEAKAGESEEAEEAEKTASEEESEDGKVEDSEEF